MKGRPWLFKIPLDKPWVWTEVKFWNKSIEMQTHFIQESNRPSMWDTTGEKNTSTKKLPRLEVVPYAAVEWISKGGGTPNELRVWL